MRYYVSDPWRAKRNARYRWLRWCWAATLVAVLATGCKSVPVVADQPLPPEATKCLQHQTQNLDPAPRFFWQLPEFLTEVVYLLSEERQLRKAERNCLLDMKAKGGIR
jgi:hypothetical protein